jgi:two-component system, OmpR family, response regulator
MVSGIHDTVTMTTPPVTQPCHRALIVEDDPAIRKLVEKLLLRRGIEIDTVHDGKEAIEKIRHGGYSVLVLDLMLPEVNGYEIIDFVKKNEINLPIAVVSAVSHQALTKLDLDVVKLVISKPFDVDEFTAAIEQLCREGGERRPLGPPAG